METVEKIKIVDDYKIWVKFADGMEKIVNIRPLLGAGFTEELLNKEKFKEVFIEEGGGLAWPNGFDICPNYLKAMQDEGQKV
jgi:hypothetical protein